MRTRSPGCSGRGRLQQLLVEVGAVGGAEILDHDDVALLVDARVARGGERILEPDLGAVAAAEHDVAVEVVDHARVVPGRALDDQPRRALRRRRRCRARRPSAGRWRRAGSAAAHAPARAAGAPPRRSRRALRATHSRNR